MRDGRIAEVLRKQNMEHCLLAPWSFGQEGPMEHQLKDPCGIAVNSMGQFIIGDDKDKNVKVFDRRGQFINHFSLPLDVNQDVIKPTLYDVASDMSDNIYVLARFEQSGLRSECFVYKFSYNWELLPKFSVKLPSRNQLLQWCLTVDSKGNVLLCGFNVIVVYGNDGQFVRSFGKGLLWAALDLTCASDGRVMVLDLPDVHIFSEQGDHLSKFPAQQCGSSFCRIAFHNSSEHVILADNKHGCLYVQMYTNDGEFVRSTQIGVGNDWVLIGVAVTTEGHIAVACMQQGQWKVLIV